MEENSSVENIVKFRKALKEIFTGESGKIVIDFLQAAYVDTPALDQSAELTYYRLGQKEFVQGLIKDATSELPDFKVPHQEDN